jgi:hypothetical protein
MAMADPDTDYVRIFIDTKFSDFIDMHLLALALVASDGAEFYAELDGYPAAACNDFVRANVLPLLGCTPGALMSRSELQKQLLAWLMEVRGNKSNLVISYEFLGAWILLTEALGSSVPAWLHADNICSRIDESVRIQFFKITRMSRHHAMWNARALRSAYRGQEN